jgi:hypothetical protein
MAVTKRAIPYFRVAEFANGIPWIVMEASSGDRLEVFKRTIGFDLPAGTSLEQAKEIAAYLTDKLIMMSET